MRQLKRIAIAIALFVVVACARQAAPPGGPPRTTPPVLLATFPDSGTAPCDFKGFAEFQFDEVTDEGATPNFGDGRGSLEMLVIFSPDTVVPSVEWHRDRIAVRPKSGWRPNRTYRIELLPGVADLHRNISKGGATISFTTCGPAPTRKLSGRVADWLAARPVPAALIEAFHLPDSARYRTMSDSSGRFTLNNLPDGPYLVVATIDNNHDRRRAANEPWDSVRVSATRDTVGEIWAFPRDTLPPRINSSTRQDSQSIVLTFSKPIDPGLRIDSTGVRVKLLVGKDSVSIGTRYAFPGAVYDSIQKLFAPPPAPLDSAGRADSVRKDSLAKIAPAKRPVAPVGRDNVTPVPPVDSLRQKRPKLGTTLVVRTVGRVELGKRYLVEVTGVRSADGRTWPTVTNVLTAPAPPSASDSAKAAKAKADSIAKADSLKRAKGDTIKPIKP